MAEILLTPELLMTQSAEMQSLQTEYEALFAQVNNALNGMNDSWSANIASNFVGKIALAQKSFSSIVNMMQNGSAAAKMGAMTFADGVGMGDLLQGFMGLSDSKAAAWVQNVMNAQGGEKAAEFVKGLLNYTGLDGDAIVEAAEYASKGDFVSALKVAYGKSADLFGEAMAKGVTEGSWVQIVGDTVGLDFGAVEKDYWSNLVSNLPEDLHGMGSAIQSGDTSAFLSKAGECAWNLSAGPVIEAGLDGAAKWTVDTIPGLKEYYEAQGADTSSGISMITTSTGGLYEEITGDVGGKEYYQHYYDDGVAHGIVEGIKDIGGFAVEKVSEGFKNLFHHSAL